MGLGWLGLREWELARPRGIVACASGIGLEPMRLWGVRAGLGLIPWPIATSTFGCMVGPLAGPWFLASDS
jgi:hypothetical protein